MKETQKRKTRKAVENAGSGRRVVITKAGRIITKTIDYIRKHKLNQHSSISNVFVY